MALFRQSLRRTHPNRFRGATSHTEPGSGPIIKAFGQLLLVLAGGLIGVLGNQFFFQRNKEIESSLELKRDYIHQQLPVYNRIVNFSYYYETGGFRSITIKRSVLKQRDQFGLIYKRDTTFFNDTITYLFPSFVTDSAKRIELISDLEIFHQNKDKIDNKVWGRILHLENFLINHPLPLSYKPEILEKSDWADSTVFKEWKKLNAILYLAAKEKLDFSFD